MNQLDNKSYGFCRKCGSPLRKDSAFCEVCGAKVLAHFDHSNHDVQSFQEYTSLINEYVSSNNQEIVTRTSLNKRAETKRITTILFCILSVILVLIGAFFIWRAFQKPFYEKKDINEINGVPEFFDIRFGMSRDEIKETIPLGTEEYFEYVYLSHDSEFKVYGINVTDALCCFEKDQLTEVYLMFSKQKTDINSLKTAYIAIYGSPIYNDPLICYWVGQETTLSIYDGSLEDSGSNNICVRYGVNNSKKYKGLKFTGPDYDPCGFIHNDNAYNKYPYYYIDGLDEGIDYIREEYSSLQRFIIFPYYYYCGITPNMTGISYDVLFGESKISTYHYMFIVDLEDDLTKKIGSIKLAIETGIDSYSICTYSPLRNSAMNTRTVSYDDFLNKVKNKESGIYTIEWRNIKDRRIALVFSIDPSIDYYSCKVSITKE